MALHHLKQRRDTFIYTIYVVGFIVALHSALPAYINSTFLGTILPEYIVGTIYTIGALVTLSMFLLAPAILRRVGNYRALIALVVLQILVVAGIATIPLPHFVLVLFVLFLVILPLLWYSLDLLLERYTDNMHTGGIRGAYFSINNLAWVISPILAGVILGTDVFPRLYLVAAILLVPALALFQKKFKTYRDPVYAHTPITKTLKIIHQKANLRRVFVTYFLLQFFYAIMVIYTPLYLHNHIGMSWKTIGIVFTIMLIPFVLIEYPLGKLADTRLGEKELMALGFVVLAVMTIVLSFITTPAIWLWALVLFGTRVGAATVEITSDTYFFKHIDAADSQLLRFFRMMYPSAYIIAPAAASLFLSLIDIRYLFLAVGIVMLIGIRYSLKLKDTL